MAYQQNQYNAPAQYSPALLNLAEELANQLGVPPNSNLLTNLKKTAFNKVNVDNDQMMALLIISNQYKLNPWTKEIHAFPAKGGGIVPVVGVDGWSRIMNDHPAFDGVEFELNESEGWYSCTIHRKDRTIPTTVVEYLDECKGNTEPWRKMPKRMLRHKALMQCCRVAFGFGGIYDEEEGSQAVENQKPIINAEYEVVENPSEKLISGAQAIKIYEMLSIANTDKSKFMGYYKVSKVEELTKLQAEDAIKQLTHNIEISKQNPVQPVQAEVVTPEPEPELIQGEEVTF